MILFASVIISSVTIALAFLYAWAKNFRETMEFMPVGLAFAGVVVGADLILIGLIGIESVSGSPTSIFLLDLLVAVRVYVFTVVGLLMARRLGEFHAEAAIPRHGGAGPVPYGASVPSREAILFALLSVGFLVLYSVGLFEITDAKLGSALQGRENLNTSISPLTVMAVAMIGFSEEIIYRLGIQNGLTYLWRSSRSGPHLAILVSTAIWCMGHIGAMDPDWVKVAQIFVFGLILGYLNRRFGIIPCMITHSLFNVVMALLTPSIFGDVLDFQ